MTTAARAEPVDPIDPAHTAKEEFIVAGRRMKQWTLALSIAATWIWAPALFVAAQQAFVNGFWGLFWFTVPNVAALVVFAPYAVRLRERVPKGYTLSHYMRQRYSKRVQGVYLAQLLIQDVCAFAVQLVAGGAIVAGITGWSYHSIVIGLAAVVLFYTFWGGLKASIFTDHVMMLIIGAVIVFCSIPVFFASGGLSTIAAGLFSHASGASAVEIALTFGVPSTIILLAGPFGFSAFWQRGFASESDETTTRAYWHSAWIFAIVPVGLGIIGFAASGVNLAVADVQLTNLTAIQEFLPTWVAWPFTLGILMGLMSTMDSAVSAASSVWGHDWSNREKGHSVFRARLGIMIIGVGAVAVAFIPGITVLYLWFFFGTSRAATFLPTVLTLSRHEVSLRLNETGMFYGVAIALTFGAPLMIYGQLISSWQLIVIGSFVAVGLSALIAVSHGYWKGDTHDPRLVTQDQT